jgi:hypothetical protein
LNLQTFLRWYGNEFFVAGFGPPYGAVQTWTDQEALDFYHKNREAIHRLAKEQGREVALQEWIAKERA